MNDRSAHWQNIYTTRTDHEVSWFENSPQLSLALLKDAGLSAGMRVIDVGGGTSRLVDNLIAQFDVEVTVLDLSSAALDAARKRLPEATSASWVVADVTYWEPDTTYDLWHDRAAFHFLNQAFDREKYVATLSKALEPGAAAVIGTFALDGPEKCSGLPITRYDAAGLQAVLGEGFKLLSEKLYTHVTPWGAEQRFQFATFRRT